jgi:hypothetical protein
MARIEEIKSGSLAKSKKLNEVIRYLNSLLNAKVREGSSTESPKLVAGEISTEIITTGGSADVPEGGGGVPEGYVETAVTLCQNGSPVTGSILFKPDTP